MLKIASRGFQGIAGRNKPPPVHPRPSIYLKGSGEVYPRLFVFRPRPRARARPRNRKRLKSIEDEYEDEEEDDDNITPVADCKHRRMFSIEILLNKKKRAAIPLTI